MKRLILTALFLVLSSTAQAGFIELSATGSYRRTNFDSNTYSTMQSLTGSISYMFWETSAIEFSYTDALNKSHGLTMTGEKYIEQIRIQLAGIDFVLSFAGKQAVFRPYIKFGGAQQRKVRLYEVGLVPSELRAVEGLSGTAGVGFRYLLSQEFALRFSVDAWTNPLPEDERTYDYAGNAGVSWIF